jgi:DNA adenine methylase
VAIEQRDALELMSIHDSPEALFFVDPPYLHDLRGTKHGYRHEMSNQDHETMITALAGLKGMVVLCGYRNDLYDSLGWHSIEKNTHADGARDRTEILWINAATQKAQTQLSLL